MVPIVPPRRRRLPIAFIVAIVAIAVPALAFANHQFSDVPAASTYHDDVEVLVGAAITTGCGGGNYCPGSAVTRGQMAAFLNRGLGIATGSYGTLPVEDAPLEYVAVVSIPAGASSGGTGYVTVAADVSVFVEEGTCPCGVLIGVDNITDGDFSPITSFVVGEAFQGAHANTGSVDWTFEVPTGADTEFGVWATVFMDAPVPLGSGTDGAPASAGNVDAMMTAEYSPFGSAFDGGPKLPAGASVETPFGPVTLGDRSE